MKLLFLSLTTLFAFYGAHALTTSHNCDSVRIICLAPQKSYNDSVGIYVAIGM